MIFRFSSTVTEIEQTAERLRLVVQPIAGVEMLELDRDSSLRHVSGERATWGELRPGARIAVSGDDDGGACLLVRDLVLHPAQERPSRSDDSPPTSPRPALIALVTPGYVNSLNI